MTTILAVANQKGGVAKTTTAVNLAACLAATQRRVLLIDLDPQGNATMGSGIHKNEIKYAIVDLLLNEKSFHEVLIRKTPAGYDLLPGNSDTTAAEIKLVEQPQGYARLKRQLAPVLGQYDYIFIDCPPSLNMLTVNAMAAANGVLIPLQCEYYALEGLSDLLNTIKQCQQTINPELSIQGILRTMYDGRNRLAVEVSAQLLSHFADKVYRTVIPRNVRLAEAPSHGLPVLLYDKHCVGSKAYLTLTGEFLRRHEARRSQSESMNETERQYEAM